MKKIKLLLTAITLSVMLSSIAFAGDLHEARAAGKIGEKLDGYAAAISSDAETNRLVAEVNAARKEKYAEISKKNSQELKVVQAAAGAKIISGLKPGEQYMNQAGQWIKK